MVKLNLRIDGIAIFVAATVVYRHLGFSWGLYALLLLAPDVFMVGYAFGTRIGALVYNAGHSQIWPAALVAAGVLSGIDHLIAVGIIWLCHIAMDHAVGYGFKYPDAFKHTHFSEV